jgi:nitrite reductase (NADH) large subunit
VHANIQKDGTFSVIPRIRGGVTSPGELRRIADVADKYRVPMVKITGSQRIDLLGVKKKDLPNRMECCSYKSPEREKREVKRQP